MGMRAWVVVTTGFAMVVVLFGVLSMVMLPTTLPVAANSDRLPSGVADGYSAEDHFPWGYFTVQWGLGLVAVAFLVYVFWRRRRT